MVELSIIICAYNLNCNYLSECLQSIFRSSLTDYEIIFVDDGSETDYSDVLKTFDNISYYKIAHNGTLAARLAGISFASGKYITFVDGDDVVSFFYHENLLLTVKNGYDVAVGAWAFKRGKSLYYCSNDSTMTDIIDEKGNALDFFFEKGGKEHARYVLWNKVFRAEILKAAALDIEKIAVDFPLCYGEDVFINYFALKHAKSVKNVGGGYYFYRLHEAQTVQAYTLARQEYLIDCISFVFDIIGGENLSKKQQDLLLKWKNLLGRDFYSKIAKENAPKLKEKIKENFALEKLEKSKLGDYIKYAVHGLLPENFFEYDKIFEKLKTAQPPVILSGCKNYGYFNEGLKSLSQNSEKTFILAKSGELAVPKPKYSLRNKIKHNKPLTVAACILFPKGSKMRKILKKLV